jgi:hypothetical protein
MQAQQRIRVSAAPFTAMVVLSLALAVGAIVGYAIGSADRWSGNAPSAQPATQLVVPQFPAATQPPVHEPQNSYD